MKGLEISEAFFREFGEPMLREQFPEWIPKIAVGLVGSGSEVLGFDDEVSRDHDFAPGFALFLPSEEEVDRRTAFLLERAYSKLPREFMGFTRPVLSPVGGDRVGVIRMADFFTQKVGEPDGQLSIGAWLRIPSFYLLEAVNGKVFLDGSGAFSAIRAGLRAMPSDVRKKRLAGQLLLMGQAGNYNYGRCVAHGETGAAQLALYEYVRAALSAAFLIVGAYEPYYKWSFRALREWPEFCEVFEAPRKLAEELEKLISAPVESVAAPGQAADEAASKQELMERISDSGSRMEEVDLKQELLERISLEIGLAAAKAGLIQAPEELSGEGEALASVRGARGAVLSGRVLSANPDRRSFGAGGSFREEGSGLRFDPERGAYEVNESIRDHEIRELDVLYCVGQ